MPTDFQNGHLGFEVRLDNSEKKVKSFKNVKKLSLLIAFLIVSNFQNWRVFLEEVILRKKSIFELMAVKWSFNSFSCYFVIKCFFPSNK